MTSQIWEIMVSFKTQKFEYLENGTQLFYEIKKILICASDTHFDKLSFCGGGNL